MQRDSYLFVVYLYTQKQRLEQPRQYSSQPSWGRMPMRNKNNNNTRKYDTRDYSASRDYEHESRPYMSSNNIDNKSKNTDNKSNNNYDNRTNISREARPNTRMNARYSRARSNSDQSRSRTQTHTHLIPSNVSDLVKSLDFLNDAINKGLMNAAADTHTDEAIDEKSILQAQERILTSFAEMEVTRYVCSFTHSFVGSFLCSV